MGWSNFRERLGRLLQDKIRLERMDDARLAQKVYLWSMLENEWMKNCMKMLGDSGMRVRWMSTREGGRRFCRWKLGVVKRMRG